MSNVLLLHPGPRAVVVPVTDVAPTSPRAARRRRTILGMPIAAFVSRAAIAVALGLALAAVLPRIVLILFGWAIARAFAG
jgi:hypothetical protein